MNIANRMIETTKSMEQELAEDKVIKILRKTYSVLSTMFTLLCLPIYLLLLYGSVVTVTHSIGEKNAVVVGTSLIFIIGCILYTLRKKLLIYYGYLEIVVALLIGGFTISKVAPESTFANFLESNNALPTLIGLISSAYIVVRGLDNINKGKEEKKKQ